MIEASQRMLTGNSQETLGGLSPTQKRHLELEIETIQNAPRCREIRETFESKAKAEGRSYAY